MLNTSSTTNTTAMTYERQILCRLADSCFHSGQALADDLGISRASIWNIVKKLESYGLEIYSVRGRGYRVPKEIDVLDEKKIAEYLAKATLTPLPKVNLYWKLASTNQLLLRSEHPAPSVCVAEMQQAGRGRRGREWISPPGGNIYFSYKWRFNLAPAQLSALSLAVSVGVLRVLRLHYANNIGLKWPNDIVYKGRKLAGILLEMQGETDGPCTVVVGIGINVRIPDDIGKKIDQPWTDLERISGNLTRRSRLVADLVCELSDLFKLYQQEQMAPFLLEWMNNDQFFQKWVSLRSGDTEITGVAKGIDAHGNFILEDSGQQRAYSSGEVSLRLKKEGISLV